MDKFTALRAVAAPFYHADVDTDEIIPHRYLRKPLSAGYGNFLFYDKRRGADEREDPAFVLNQAPYRGAQILVSGRNFGCGSTREGAVYALLDSGIRAVIAPSFADTFSGNCLQNGVLPVVLPERAVEDLCRQLQGRPGAEVTIDLAQQKVTLPDGRFCTFDIQASKKAQLLEGLDDIAVTLKHRDAIAQFETQYRARLPWLRGAGA